MSQYQTRRKWSHEYFVKPELTTDKEIRKWCKDNLAGKHHVVGHKVVTPILENQKVIAVIVRIDELEDAVLFKLRWFNHLA